MRLYTAVLTFAIQIICTVNAATTQNATDLAFRMVKGNIARDQGCSLASTKSMGEVNYIELGAFHQALRESIANTNDPQETQSWTKCLNRGISTSIHSLSNSSADTELPLDRFSVGTSMIDHYSSTGNDDVLSAIKALQKSIALQPRNANGGLWYFANPGDIKAYKNLSYLDGMYSYPPFTILSTIDPNSSIRSNGQEAGDINLDAMYKQLQILYDVCKQPNGLLVHGYDAIKAHKWAKSSPNGASPIVWGRSLAWYTLGILNSLEFIQNQCISSSGPDCQGARAFYTEMKKLFNSIILAQIKASENAVNVTGNYGVYQVVDQPGKAKNFVESSASCFTVYSLLKSIQLGVLDSDLTQRAEDTASGIYKNVLNSFLVENKNGSLSLTDTSGIATLSVQDISYSYYVNVPKETNSLLGTSAFVLASLQVGMMDGSS